MDRSCEEWFRPRLRGRGGKDFDFRGAFGARDGREGETSEVFGNIPVPSAVDKGGFGGDPDACDAEVFLAFPAGVLADGGRGGEVAGEEGEFVVGAHGGICVTYYLGEGEPAEGLARGRWGAKLWGGGFERCVGDVDW